MTLDEVSAELAEVQDALTALAAQMDGFKRVADNLAELVKVLGAQKPAAAPQVTMTVPPAPPPQIKVEGAVVNLPPPGECDIVHTWGIKFGQVVCEKSTVVRRVAKE